MKKFLIAILGVAMFASAALADDPFIFHGSTATVSAPSGIAFATDTIESLDKWMEYIQDNDKEAQHQLMLEPLAKRISGSLQKSVFFENFWKFALSFDAIDRSVAFSR